MTTHPIDVAAVDWSSLSHAYGPATDIPGILIRLLSPSPQDSTAVYYDLYHKICHQTASIYSATAPVVSFALQVLDRPEAHCRARMLSLISSVAFVARYPAGDESNNLACLQVIASAMPQLFRCLNDPNVNVRRLAPYALTQVFLCDVENLDGLDENVRQTIAAAICEALQREKESSTVASLVLAAAEMSAEQPQVKRLVFDTFNEDGQDETVRVAAAYGISRMVESPPDEVVDVLMHAIEDSKTVNRRLLLGRGRPGTDPEVNNLWFDRNPHYFFLKRLLALPRSFLPRFSSMFRTLVLADHEMTFESVSLPIMRFVFGSTRLDTLPNGSSLSEEQRVILKALQDNTHIWGSNYGIFLDVTRTFGLTVDQAGRDLLARLLA